MQVRFNWRYQSGLGTWGQGDVADLSDALVAALGADSPGVVSPYHPAPEVVATDPQEGTTGEGVRQVTTARNRGRPPGSKNRTAAG